MQIYVVKEGDSLHKIANQFNVSRAALISVNELTEPNNLVVGQALVIPIIGQFYTVEAGDSLYKIANEFGIPITYLVQVNQISFNHVLMPGQQLYIPPQVNKKEIEVNAYIEPLTMEVSETLVEAAKKASPFLTYLAPFSYRISREGALIPPPLDDFFQIARRNNATLMMVITNLEEGAFSSELGHLILTNTHLQDQLLTEIVNTAIQEGFQDVHFDFEFLLPEDRENYNQFLEKAAKRIHQAGLLISTALAPKTSDEQEGPWYTAHDYAFHGKTVDFVVLMTYEWGYSAGPAMAVSPIGPVEKVVQYATSVMPSYKVMLGQNLYGYDWTLPFVEGTYARAISPQQAIQIARDNNVPISYDKAAQAPYFNYVGENGSNHEVWFEDARSIQQKFNLINRYNLRGISYWKLGLSFPQNWLLLDSRFKILKRN